MNFKITKYILVFFTLYFLLPAQTAPANYGILFPKSDTINRRVFKDITIDLTQNKSIKVNSEINVTFEFTFRDTERIGNILTIYDESRKNIYHLIYDKKYHKDTSLFSITINGNETDIKIKQAKDKLFFTQTCKFQISTENKNIVLGIGKEFVKKYVKDIPSELDIKIFFGAKLPMSDYPYMSIKNISISADKKNTYFWPLNETEGDIAKEENGLLNAKINNCKWLNPTHFKWEKIKEYTLFHSLNPGIAFNTKTSEIYIIDEDSIIKFSASSGNTAIIETKNSNPAKPPSAVIDSKTGRIFCTYAGLGRVTIYDEKSNTWTQYNNKNDFEGHYYLHKLFYDDYQNSLYSFGGYGWYTFKNDLQKYNFNSNKWEKINLSGDFIPPRNGAGICSAFNPGEYLIFSGHGTVSGKQQDGERVFLDLYLLNTINKSIKKIWNIEEIGFDNINDIYRTFTRSKKTNKLYTMASKPGQGIQLYEINGTKPEITRAGEVKEFTGNPYIQWAYLFYDELNDQLLFIYNDYITENSTKVLIWSISLPLYSEAEYQQLITANEDKDNSYFIYFASGLFLIIAGISTAIFIFRYKKKNSEKKEIEETDNIPLTTESKSNVSNKHKRGIYTFGDFSIFIGENGNLAEKLSPKLKELLILMLIYTYNNNGNRGIHTQKLTDLIWPYLDKESAKNARGVSINHLRKVFKDTNEILIETEHNKWFLTVSEDFYCDFREFITFMHSLKNGMNDLELEKLSDFISGGNFLSDIDYQWLEPIKADITSKILNFLYKAGHNIQDRDNYEMLLKIADLILLQDSLDETGVRWKIKALTMLDRHSTAVKFYTNFTENFQKIIGEKYKKTFDELIN